MRARKPESRRTACPFGPPGFTLVELLVVISVILLLAALLMPAVQVVIRQAYAGKSAVMVRMLHDGALLYKEKTRFLPGEKKDTKVPGGSGYPRQAMDGGHITGSQVLAACLFNIEYNELGLDYSKPANASRIDASKVFATFKPEYLINHHAGKKNSISDGFPGERAKAICYFLASNNSIHAGKVSQFRIKHNQAYMTEDGNLPTGNAAQLALENWVNDRRRSANQVLNNGGFILIAPGLNREYLVVDIDDPDNQGQTKDGPDRDDIANDYGSKKQP